MSFNDVLGHSRRACEKPDNSNDFGISEGRKACTKSRVMKCFSNQAISIKEES
jgi:hypothetical protein